jgi:hypothetical protein
MRIHAGKALSKRSQSDYAEAVEEGAAIIVRFTSGVVSTFCHIRQRTIATQF